MGVEKAILLSYFLLLLAIPVSAQDWYTTTQTYIFIGEAKVEVRDLTLSAYSVYRGASVDFSVTLRNFGTASTEATAEVKIYDASNTTVGTISYDPISLAPGQIATIEKTWSVGSLPTGTYRAVGQATYESNVTNIVEETFSVVLIPPLPPSQQMGQLVPVVLPSIITPVAGKAVFLKTTILRELLAGEGNADSISLKNIGEGILNITLSFEGIPNNWVVLPSDKTLLLPNETRVLNLGFSIPPDTLAGDYLVQLHANGGANSTDFLALRVRNYPEDYDKPIALKTIKIDENERTTLVSIDVKNPSLNTMEVVQVQERIPALVSDEQIEFLDKQGKITELNGAKMIVWELSNVKSKESFYVSYNIKNFITDYSTYMNWHISQIVVTQKRTTADLVKILDMTSSGINETGYGEVTASVLYVGTEPIEVTMLLEVPQGFSAEPAAVTKTLIPKGVTSSTFRISTQKTTQDTHMVRFVVLGSDFSTYMAAPVIIKREAHPVSFSILSVLGLNEIVIISSFVAAAVTISVISYRRISRRSAPTYSSERLNYLKNIKDMVVGKNKK